MSYFTIVTDVAGQGGQNPRRIKVITDDNLATVKTAGYINSKTHAVLLATDIIDMIYSYSTLTTSGTYGCFTVGISASGVITLTQWADTGNVVLPVVSGDAAVFVGTSGQIGDAGAPPILTNKPVGQTVLSATSSPTPGNITALTALVTESASSVTSNTLVGCSGEVDCVGINGGFVYGIRGKVVSTGTILDNGELACIFGQLNLSGATIPSAVNMALIWGDMGPSAPSGIIPGFHSILISNGTNAIPESHIFLEGGASDLFQLFDDSLTSPTYFLNAGTSSGSAGDTTKCNASKTLRIQVNGTTY